MEESSHLIRRPDLGINRVLRWVWTRKGFLADVVLFPLTFLACLYGLVSRIRVVFYEKGIFRKQRVDAFVISIGNLTVGGTGKTPLTIYLAREWKRKGCSVGIVSRGYRRKDRRSVVMVSDGSKMRETVSAVGDEPALMADCLDGVPIVVSADRSAGCRWLIENFKSDVILLDDGFQHLRLHRDMNILVVDASNPLGNQRLLPRGPLREPRSAFQRADLVIFTRTDIGCDYEELRHEISGSGRRVLQSIFRPTGLKNLNTDMRHPASDLEDCPILCVCGIGNPDAFIKTIIGMGAKVKGVILFGDHHAYSRSDLLEVRRQLVESGAVRVVTTAKDATKIKPFFPMDLEVWVVQIDVVFLEDPEEYESLLFKMKTEMKDPGPLSRV